MGATLAGFDANQVDPNQPLEPVPAGRYLAHIKDSGMKQIKKGKGKYLALTFEILDGPYKGRNLWANLNLENSNADAVRIARGDLSAICRAVGVMTPKDSVELHNIPLVLVVGHKKRDDTGDLANVLKGYEKKGATPPATTATAPAANGGTKPPWEK